MSCLEQRMSTAPWAVAWASLPRVAVLLSFLAQRRLMEPWQDVGVGARLPRVAVLLSFLGQTRTMESWKVTALVATLPRVAVLLSFLAQLWTRDLLS